MSAPQKKANAALGKPAVTQKEFEKLNSTANGVAGVIETLRIKLQVLDSELKADEDGKAEYERQIVRLKIKRDEIETRVKASKQWAEQYDRDIGPFQSTYGKNTEGMAAIYDEAKKKHSKGIQMLVEEFDYHPAFKRHSDTFSATPFRPK